MSENRSPSPSREERVVKANEFLRICANYGRRFFSHGGRVSKFEIGQRGHIFLRDRYTDKLVYVAYNGRWRGFSEGGTLRDLVKQIASYIRTGQPVRTSLLGPWPDWYCGGDLWGYGAEMAKVRAKGIELGIFTLPEEANG